MADRVRMKSNSSFDNPFIYNHEKDREGRTFVQEGDAFSTEPEHGEQLFRSGLADKASGSVSDRTERQDKLKGAQTSADTLAVTTNRNVNETSAPVATAPASKSTVKA